MNHGIKLVAATLTLFVCLAATAATAAPGSPYTASAINKLLRGSVPVSVASSSAVNQSNGIQYNGGPIMGDNPLSYVVVWYGNWNTSNSNLAAAQPIVEGALRGLGGSSWSNIMTTYSTSTQTFGNYSTASVISLVANTDVTTQNSAPYKRGLSVTDQVAIVTWAVRQLNYSSQQNVQYIVLTSDDVAFTLDGTPNTVGFPHGACGWHNSFVNSTIGSTSVKYAYIGNPAQYTVCIPALNRTTVSPNNYPAVDGLISSMAHEVAEMTTDPDLNAWSGSNGEIGDYCNFLPLETQQAPNGSWFNVTWSNMRFLTQSLWVNNNGGYCANSYQSMSHIPTPPSCKTNPRLCA